MKKNIHPVYYSDAKIICACGNNFTIGSTIKEIRVEICSHCHPFFTSKQKLIDEAGRIDSFNAKLTKKEILNKKLVEIKKSNLKSIKKTNAEKMETLEKETKNKIKTKKKIEKK